MIILFQAAIAAAGGIKALVDLILRWPAGTDGVLVCIFDTSQFSVISMLLAILFWIINFL